MRSFIFGLPGTKFHFSLPLLSRHCRCLPWKIPVSLRRCHFKICLGLYTNVIEFDVRKVLCVIHHIQHSCEKHSAGLGLWSQQSTNSLHLDFEKTWMSYKVNSLDPFYRSQLLKVAFDYNCKHAMN